MDSPRKIKEKLGSRAYLYVIYICFNYFDKKHLKLIRIYSQRINFLIKLNIFN